jgi:CheY-like chemotaxis protein
MTLTARCRSCGRTFELQEPVSPETSRAPEPGAPSEAETDPNAAGYKRPVERIGLCPVCSSPVDRVVDVRDHSDQAGSQRTIDLRDRIDRSRTVLIVDDDAEVRRTLRAVLEMEGLSVVGEVSNGPDAVLFADRKRPSFVFLDQLMPAMSGEDAAQLIRKTSPESTIIAFSAVLDEQPTWAEAFLRKDRIAEAGTLVLSLT